MFDQICKYMFKKKQHVSHPACLYISVSHCQVYNLFYLIDITLLCLQ